MFNLKVLPKMVKKKKLCGKREMTKIFRDLGEILNKSKALRKMLEQFSKNDKKLKKKYVNIREAFITPENNFEKFQKN